MKKCLILVLFVLTGCNADKTPAENAKEALKGAITIALQAAASATGGKSG